MSRWTPILPPASALARRATESAMAVVEALSCDEAPPPGWREWRYCQEALLYGYLARLGDDDRWRNRALERLNDAITGTSNGGRVPSLALHGGLCGMGWVVEHLSHALADSTACEDGSGLGEPPEDDEDAIDDIDAAVLQRLEKEPWRKQYDLISGLVGFGVYFLERLPLESAEHGIVAVLDQLEGRSQRTKDGITWETVPELLPDWQRELCPNGYYNLGAAHGIPGVIYFLSEVVAAEICVPRAGQLLDATIQWLIAQRRPDGSLSWFSSWIADGRSTDSRLAWCYGDLGILAVLLHAARRARRDDWREFSHGLLDHCVAWSFERSGIKDAGLCHGAAGVAHIFNRIYQHEGHAGSRDAAVAWFERTLSMRQPGVGYGGFQMYHPSETPVWKSDPAFLDGSTGVALALLAATTSVEPNWDRMLLLSGRDWSERVRNIAAMR
jgi:lantibiotic biosynthesis protein